MRSVLQVAFLLPGLGRYRWPAWNTATTRDAWKRLRVLLAGTIPLVGIIVEHVQTGDIKERFDL